MRIPIEVSARHVHLSKGDLERLFGDGFQLSKLKDLSQGQFAAKETLTLVGPKGRIENVRIVGPTLAKTKVAISATDAYELGLTPPLLDCLDEKLGALITLVGPKDQIQILGAIIPQRHIYLGPESAQKWKLKNGDLVSVSVSGPRSITFHNVLVKIGKESCFRIDIDEANASGVKSGDWGEVIK